MAHLDPNRTIAAEWSFTNDLGIKQSVSGMLSFSEEPPSHLIHLSRDFHDDADEQAFFSSAYEQDVYPVIHGNTTEGWFTAVDARPFRSTRTFGGARMDDIVLRPAFVIKGNVLLHDDELSATEVQVKFWDQDAWAEWSSWEFENPSDELDGVRVTQKSIPTRSAEYEGVSIELEDATLQRIWHQHRDGVVTLVQSSMFRLRFPDAVPLRRLMRDWLRPLSFLIGSGTRRTPGIESMLIRNSGWTSDEDGSPMSDWLEVFPRNPKRKFASDDEIHFLLRGTQLDFGRQVPVILGAIQAHETAVEQYLDFVHNRPNTAMVQLTTLAQLLETFDRSLSHDPDVSPEQRHAATSVRQVLNENELTKPYAKKAEYSILESHRPSLARRLSRLDRETNSLLRRSIGDGNWIANIATVRNAVVHGLPSSQFFVRNIIPLQVSVDILEILMEARMLVMMGFSPEEADSILTKSDPRWFGRINHIKQYLHSFDNFQAFATRDVLPQAADADSIARTPSSDST